MHFFGEDSITNRLSELLNGPLERRRPKVLRHRDVSGFVLRFGDYKFVIEPGNSGTTEAVSSALEKLRRGSRRIDGIPVVVVPHMGEVGKRLCSEAGVGWIDLSGNADLSAPGLRVKIEGRPNPFKPLGRPSDVFAPKSSRVTRYLLTHWYSAFSVRGLAKETVKDPGFTSRILSRLEAQGFISRKGDAIRVQNPDLLLDAWRIEYKFLKHRIIRGHIAARSSEDLVHDLAQTFKKCGIRYAATGLSAAWLFTHFAGFRLAAFYLHEPPSEELLRRIEFREDPRGANVWLVVPNDEGVFQGQLPESESDDVQCVHPVQIYLDLKDHPERSAEAADELRKRFLKWKLDA